MAEVVLQNVSKTFPGTKDGIAAVKNLSLSVAHGELLGIVGPSGGGKTTLLRLIAGLEETDGGTISIDGQSMNGVEPKDRNVAMVLQNHALYPHMTVYENLAFPLKLRKYRREQVSVRVQETADILALRALMDRKPDSLSGGQRQRVAVGRAIVQRPRVFLFDEPLSNLDATTRVQMRTEVARLHAKLGVTMLYVTHDQVEAMTIGQRIAVMNEGAIEQVARPIELYDRPATMFVAGFIGSPAMNFFEGNLVRADGALYFCAFNAGGQIRLKLRVENCDLLESYATKSVILGMRPEHVKVSSDRDSVPAEVELVEPLGPETIVHLRIGSYPCRARLPGLPSFALGDKVRLDLDVTRAHFFDPKSHRRIA